MVGGYNFEKSMFNRTYQAKRQPGSSFKPIFFAAALDKGYSGSSIWIDSPYIWEEGEEAGASRMMAEEDAFTGPVTMAGAEKKERIIWKPGDYDGEFKGPMTMLESLAKSVNNVSIKIMADIKVGYAIKYAKRLGIESTLEPNLTLALGSSAVTLEEMTLAYSVFASGGYRWKPYFVEKVVDREGNTIEENGPELVKPEDDGLFVEKPPDEPAPEETTASPAPATNWAPTGGRVISEQAAYLITDLLRNVVEHGTGWRVKALGLPAAGKTGTTQDYKDAWFVGYTPMLTTGVWVGFDNSVPLGRGEAGARAASPIWLEYMQNALADLPARDFAVPKGIIFAKIDPENGLLATSETKNPIFAAYREGMEPRELSRGITSPDESDLFRE
jgi:penicillin-binding protein 1A